MCFGITSKIIYANKKATDVLVACWPVCLPAASGYFWFWPFAWPLADFLSAKSLPGPS